MGCLCCQQLVVLGVCPPVGTDKAPSCCDQAIAIHSVHPLGNPESVIAAQGNGELILRTETERLGLVSLAR